MSGYGSTATSTGTTRNSLSHLSNPPSPTHSLRSLAVSVDDAESVISAGGGDDYGGTSISNTLGVGVRNHPRSSSLSGIGGDAALLPTSRNIFRSHMGGVRAAVVEGPGVYYMGIIDVLQRYTLKKRFERWIKVLLMRDGKGAPFRDELCVCVRVCVCCALYAVRCMLYAV